MFSFMRSSPISSPNAAVLDKKAAERDVHQFVISAQKVADDILGPDSRNDHYRCECVGRVRTRHFWTWWPITPFYLDPYPYPHHYRGRSYSSNHDSDSPLRMLVGFAAVVLGGYAIFKTVEAVSRSQEASEELRDNWEFKNRLRIYENLHVDLPNLQQIKQIANLKQKIFAGIKSNSAWNIAMLVSVVAASTLALVGAVAASGILMFTGTAAAMTTGVFMLCRWSVDTVSKQNRYHARQLRNCLASFY